MIAFCQLSTRRLGLLFWPRRPAPDPQLIIYEWLSTHRNETDVVRFLFSDLEKFQILIMYRDGKRFNNFLINLSSFEILIVLLCSLHQMASMAVIVTFPAQFHQTGTFYVFGAELGLKIFWSVDSKHIGYKTNNIWRGGLAGTFCFSLKLNFPASLYKYLFTFFINFSFWFWRKSRRRTLN